MSPTHHNTRIGYVGDNPKPTLDKRRSAHARRSKLATPSRTSRVLPPRGFAVATAPKRRGRTFGGVDAPRRSVPTAPDAPRRFPVRRCRPVLRARLVGAASAAHRARRCLLEPLSCACYVRRPLHFTGSRAPWLPAGAALSDGSRTPSIRHWRCRPIPRGDPTWPAAPSGSRTPAPKASGWLVGRRRRWT